MERRFEVLGLDNKKAAESVDLNNFYEFLLYRSISVITNSNMPKRSSSSMEILLGLLTIEPMSGYDLGLTIRGSVGHFWNESYGQIYPNLKRLTAEGLVTSKTERQKGKPDRHIYSITGKGREHLAAWLAVEPQPEIPRNELLLKLFFGAQVPVEILIGYVERMAETERALLQKFTRAGEEEIAANRQYPDAPYWQMAVRFGQLELEAHQRWAEETLAELNRIARR
jgi:PadR family transcriptional regulator, regulatory protein AphA